MRLLSINLAWERRRRRGVEILVFLSFCDRGVAWARRAIILQRVALPPEGYHSLPRERHPCLKSACHKSVTPTQRDVSPAQRSVLLPAVVDVVPAPTDVVPLAERYSGRSKPYFCLAPRDTYSPSPREIRSATCMLATAHGRCMLATAREVWLLILATLGDCSHVSAHYIHTLTMKRDLERIH